MKTIPIGLLLALAVVAASAQTPTDLARQAAVVKPAPQELKWQQIPWVLDLAAAQHMAQAEKRPIFLWVSGDDPLERC